MALGVVLVAERARAESSEVATISIEGQRPQPESAPRGQDTATSIAPRERFAQPGMSVAEVLREEPGIQIVELGGLGAPATASLRGANAQDTPVYLGGVRINDEVGGVANLADVPGFFVERAEIYRSHAPLLAGGLGTGGAVWFEPRRPTSNGAQAGAMVGSYGSRSATGYAALASRGSSLLAGVELAAADNDYAFWNGNGTHYDPSDDQSSRLTNADASVKNLWLAGSHKLGRATLRVLYHHADREQGAVKLAVTQSEVARVRLGRDMFALTSQIPIDDWRGALELTSSALTSATTIDDPLKELGLGTPRTSTPGERFEQTVTARQATAGSVRFAEFLSTSSERLRRFEQRNSVPTEVLSARRVTVRGGAQAEVPLFGPLALEAMLGFASRGTAANSALHLDQHEPSGRAGLFARLANSEAYASAGRYHRPPTLSELYGASLLVRGNDGLNPESGTVFELGGRHQLLRADRERLAWVDAAAFARFSSDLITYVATAQGYLHPLNRDSARTLGAEFALGAAPWRWLDAEGTLSLLDPRDTSPDRVTKNDVLPYVSRATVSALLSFRQNLGLDWLDSWRLGLRALHRSSRYANPAGDGVIPAQTTLDLEAAATGIFRSLTARLRVADIFDVQRYDVVGFPLPGRSAFLSLEATL